MKKIPEGRWKHLQKSMEWEAYNKNTAKGLVGKFSVDGRYLKWQADEPINPETIFMEVKDIEEVNGRLWIKHRSGLQYWFEKVEDTNGTKKRKTNTTTRSPSGGNPASGNGQRGEARLS